MPCNSTKPTLFEYSVVYDPRPTRAELDANTTPPSVVVIDTKTELAKDTDALKLKIGRALPEEHVEHIDDLRIYIRPFGTN